MTAQPADQPTTALTPASDPDSEGFWAALREGVLRVPRCSAGHRFFPPMPGCPVCGDADVSLAPASGRGRVYSWATVHIALHPAFTADEPYTVVVAELEEGGRMLGRLLGEGGQLAADAPLAFETYAVGDVVLPGFRLEPRP